MCGFPSWGSKGDGRRGLPCASLVFNFQIPRVESVVAYARKVLPSWNYTLSTLSRRHRISNFFFFRLWWHWVERDCVCVCVCIVCVGVGVVGVLFVLPSFLHFQSFMVFFYILRNETSASGIFFFIKICFPRLYFVSDELYFRRLYASAGCCLFVYVSFFLYFYNCFNKVFFIQILFLSVKLCFRKKMFRKARNWRINKQQNILRRSE